MDAGLLAPIHDFSSFGIFAFTTNRHAGSFSTASDEPVSHVMARWNALRAHVAPVTRLATAHQVHGTRVLVHARGWTGWLRSDDADGHAALERGTALAVSVADCIPVFLAHPSGAITLLHAGWRGTAGRIAERGVAELVHRGIPARELRAHLGPGICGDCYEVGPDVYRELTGRATARPARVDLRALLASQLRELGVHDIVTSVACTQCDNDRFFSHRAGDTGRQLGVIGALGDGSQEGRISLP